MWLSQCRRSTRKMVSLKKCGSRFKQYVCNAHALSYTTTFGAETICIAVFKKCLILNHMQTPSKKKTLTNETIRLFMWCLTSHQHNMAIRDRNTMLGCTLKSCPGHPRMCLPSTRRKTVLIVQSAEQDEEK